MMCPEADDWVVRAYCVYWCREMTAHGRGNMTRPAVGARDL